MSGTGPAPKNKPAQNKGAARALTRTPAQVKAAEERAAAQAEADALVEQTNAAKAQAAQLAQIVNLHIAGYSLDAIGAEIGMTGPEVDRMLAANAARYVRSQPQLRVYVRNWISEHYTALLEAVWKEASDPLHPNKLENQDRAVRLLDRMAKLHGAEAPTQAEVTVAPAPEAVDRLVTALAGGAGLGYDVSIFDMVPGEVIHEAHEQAAAALEQSSTAVGEPRQDETDDEL